MMEEVESHVNDKPTVLSTDLLMRSIEIITTSTYLCDICGQALNSAEQIEKHVAAVHKFNNDFDINSDGSRMPKVVSDYEVNRQCKLTTDFKESLLICDECGEKFNSKFVFLNHLKAAHSTVDETHSRTSTICGVCSKSISTTNFLKHLKIRHKLPSIEEQIVELTCRICNSGFTDEESIRDHFRLLHRFRIKDLDIFKKCKFCGKEISKSNMRKHEKVVHENEINTNESNKGGIFFCSGDKRIYVHGNTVKDLRRSTNFFQTDDTVNLDAINFVRKKRKCDICGKSISAAHWYKHKKTVHDTIKAEKILNEPIKYVCDICGRVFAKRIEIINHFYQAHNASYTYKEPEDILDFVTDEKANEIQEKYLPNGFEYVEFIKANESIDEFLLEFKFSLSDGSKLDDWIHQYEEKNNTVLKLGGGIPKYKNTNILKKITYRCIRNSKPRKTTCPREKHTGCPFKMFIRVIKKQICRIGKQSKFLAHVTLRHRHNHPLNRQEWLRYKPPAPEVVKEFYTLFKEGYSASKALQLYSQKLRMEEEDLSAVPLFHWVYYQHAKVVKEQCEQMVVSTTHNGKK